MQNGKYKIEISKQWSENWLEVSHFIFSTLFKLFVLCSRDDSNIFRADILDIFLHADSFESLHVHYHLFMKFINIECEFANEFSLLFKFFYVLCHSRMVQRNKTINSIFSIIVCYFKKKHFAMLFNWLFSLIWCSHSWILIKATIYLYSLHCK